MERFQDGAVVVQLCQGRIKGNKKCVIDARVTYIMTDGRDKEGEGIEGFEETGDGRLGSCVA